MSGVSLFNLSPDDVMDNLRRRYGAIMPTIEPHGCMAEDAEAWERKGLDTYYIWALQDLCSEFGYDNVRATEELAWIYFLILKKQEGHLNPYERRALKTLILDFLDYIQDALYQWLVVHGVIKDFDTFQTVLMGAYYHSPEDWWKLIDEKRAELEEEGEDVDGWTEEEILEEVIKDLWEERTSDDSFRWLNNNWGKEPITSVIERARKLMEKIERFQKTPELFPLKDYILLLDEAVDFEHQNGKLLEDIYFYVDVVLAKKLAERKFAEVYGGEAE